MAEIEACRRYALAGNSLNSVPEIGIVSCGNFIIFQLLFSSLDQ